MGFTKEAKVGQGASGKPAHMKKKSTLEVDLTKLGKIGAINH